MFSQNKKLIKAICIDFYKRHGSNVAFIGLGNMGSRMAKNLIKKGQNLKVYDKIPEAASSVQGAKLCKSPEEAAKDASIVITMLPSGKIAKEAIFGENGAIKSMPKNALLVDCSTIEPETAQYLFEASKQNDVRFLDAPVSGGITGAEAGTLAFMVGGREEDFKEVEPVLLKMGSKSYFCGKSGSGQIAKICNNLVLGITMAATAEGLNLGVKLGMDPKLLTSIMNVSTARSWSTDTYNPVPGVMENVPSSRDYEGGFLTKLVVKDLGIAEGAAIGCGALMPLGALTHQLYRAMMLNGYADKDFASVYLYLSGNKK